MNPQLFRELCQLADKRNEKRSAYLRHLLLLASGTLAALVTLRANDHSTGMALWALRTAWVALGLGILLGSSALHAEVWTAAELARQMADKIKSPTSPSDDLPSAIYANPPRRYEHFAQGCYASLLLAVLSLVTHAWLR